ncbi:MAG: translocation/assembly module TamB domain-containing protein [Terriglobia bacterium]
MRSSLRVSKPFRILVAIVAVCLAVYFGFTAVLGSRWFHDRLEQRIVARLESATGARVELRDIEIKPAVFEVTIHGLTLHGSEGPAGPPLFSARTIVLRINPLSVLRRKLMITALDGDGITAHLITRAAGSTNIPGLPGRPSATAADLVNASIASMILQHATLYWNDERIPLDLKARHSAVLIRHSPQGGYSGAFASTPLDLTVRGTALPSVKLAGRIEISAAGIRLRQLVWRSPAISGQGAASLEWSPRIRGSGSFEAAGAVSVLARTLRWNVFRSGELRLRCDVQYEAGRLLFAGHAGLSGLRVRTPPVDPGPMEFSADFSGNPGAINLTHLNLHALGGRFSGSGAIRFVNRTPEFAVRGRAERVDLAKTLRTTPRTAKLGRLLALSSNLSGEGEARWEGMFDHFTSTFSVRAVPADRLPAGARPVTGEAHGSIVGEPQFVLKLDQAQFATPHSSFRAHGTLAESRASLGFQYSTTDFNEAEPLIDEITGLTNPIPVELHSAVILTGTVGGRASNPQIQGHLRVGVFTYRGWVWESFGGDVNASSEEVAVGSGRLRSGPSVFEFTGSAGLHDWEVTPQSPLRLSARAQRSPLKGLDEALGLHYPITGVASGEIDVHGTPRNLSGSGNFRVARGSAYGESFDLISTRVVASNAQWNFESVMLRKGAGKLAGWIRLNRPARTFAAQLRGGGFALDNFQRLRIIRASEKLQGTAGIAIEGSGSLSAPSLRATVHIRNLKLGGNAEGHAAATLQFAARRLTATASLRGAEGSLTLSAAAVTRGDWPAKITGSFSRFRLDPWLNLAGRTRIETPVIASGSISGQGPFKKPRQFEVDAKAEAVAVQIPDFPVRNAQPVEVRYANGRIESNRFEIRGPSTSLRIHLSGRVQKPAEFALDAQGEAQASLLRLFDPSLQAVGRFSLDLHDRGPVDRPALSGEIRVENLSVRYGNLPLPLSGLNGVIVLEGNRAVIQSLDEEAGQASISLSGGATFGAGRGFDVQAAFRRIRLEYPAGISSLVSGTLKLAGTPEAAELTGEVTVGEMFASPDFNVLNWLGNLGTSLETPPAAPAATFASKVRVGVRVMTNPVVRLDSPTLSYVAAIDATLRGTLSQPSTMGDIHIHQGTALIAGNRYQIARGDITMTSPYQTAPVVDIEARTRVERYDLTVELAGPADRIKMSYRSDPPLPTEDILSLLALGYAPGQTLMSSSGTERMGAAGAGSLLTTALSTQVSGRFQKLFGVSRIRVDPNLLGPTTAGGARITVEEQVSRDLSMTYSTNTAAAQQRDIRLRWDVSDRISLIGERDINGVYGFEVRFRRRLR